MSEPLASTLEHWREFFVLLGTAAAALVALLFVAASIGAGFIKGERASQTRLYMSPVVLHFTAVLVACCIGLIPWHTRATFGLLLAAGALGAGIYAALVAAKVLHDRHIDLADRLAYGITPIIAYAAGIIAAGLFFIDWPHAAEVLAAALLLLLVVNIRNAWDLMLFLTEKHADPG